MSQGFNNKIIAWLSYWKDRDMCTVYRYFNREKWQTIQKIHLKKEADLEQSLLSQESPKSE